MSATGRVTQHYLTLGDGTPARFDIVEQYTGGKIHSLYIWINWNRDHNVADYIYKSSKDSVVKLDSLIGLMGRPKIARGALFSLDVSGMRTLKSPEPRKCFTIKWDHDAHFEKFWDAILEAPNEKCDLAAYLPA